MFERYTEKARRVIFFARHEANQAGAAAIEADFLLLGILRENPSVGDRWLGTNYVNVREAIRREFIEGHIVSNNADLPLSDQSKRVLAHAAEEADRLGHSYIGTEHLFLGLLHESDLLTAKMFKARSGELKKVREAVPQEPERSEAGPLANAASIGIQMKLVNERGNDLGVVLAQGRVPDIGEAISISDEKNTETIYRIRDVIWRVKVVASTLRVLEVTLKLNEDKLQG